VIKLVEPFWEGGPVALNLKLQQLMQEVLQNGRVEGHELERLKEELAGDGRIDRSEADFLVELHRRVQRRSPAFEHFFYQMIKRYVLTDGAVNAAEAGWLRGVITGQGKVGENEVRFLRELRGEAKTCSPEFEALCNEYAESA
jgi:hypothetical protein